MINDRERQGCFQLLLAGEIDGQAGGSGIALGGGAIGAQQQRILGDGARHFALIRGTAGADAGGLPLAETKLRLGALHGQDEIACRRFAFLGSAGWLRGGGDGLKIFKQSRLVERGESQREKVGRCLASTGFRALGDQKAPPQIVQSRRAGRYGEVAHHLLDLGHGHAAPQLVGQARAVRSHDRSQILGVDGPAFLAQALADRGATARGWI